MNQKQAKKLKEKLITQQSVKTVGGISVPRKLPTAKNKPKVISALDERNPIRVEGTRTGRFTYTKSNITEVERPLLKLEPGMPGFNSSFNDKKMRRNRIGKKYKNL